ncbi:hypothetical protein Cmtc_18680 [Cupriavidus sp. TKC]|uniref:FkbM family methyltransferase n=1 Tax=Cupriavidus sp. TKC TaxID=2880159 RepID=UPI0025A7BBCE|nr:FkbM family methyltransferase [Cupriavidus sp. TKC]GMG90648.1 hypothetical protein Cmtc_18680 [Cupriavidus sp. TKC]
MLKSFFRRLSAFATRDVTHELVQLRSDIKGLTEAFQGVVKAGQAEDERWNEYLKTIAGATDQTRHLAITQLKVTKLASLGADPVVSFFHNGTIPIRFFVPKAATDYIQGYHLFHESFWDVAHLQRTDSFVKGKAVLDIGANVGNHLVYWARVAGAKSITAFEPIPELFEILQRNISLNGVHNAEALNVALGREESFGSAVSSGDNRMQSEVHATAVEAAGSIKIVALDELEIAEADFAKIDVEGHTLDLLHGATKTLRRLRPAIFVELFEHERKACHEILTGIGYEMRRAAADSNYLYVHPSRPFDGELGFL